LRLLPVCERIEISSIQVKLRAIILPPLNFDPLAQTLTVSQQGVEKFKYATFLSQIIDY